MKDHEKKIPTVRWIIRGLHDILTKWIEDLTPPKALMCKKHNRVAPICTVSIDIVYR